jgi:hypothetical protein
VFNAYFEHPKNPLPIAFCRISPKTPRQRRYFNQTTKKPRTYRILPHFNNLCPQKLYKMPKCTLFQTARKLTRRPQPPENVPVILYNVHLYLYKRKKLDIPMNCIFLKYAFLSIFISSKNARFLYW